MANEKITVLNMGEEITFNNDTKIIKFEGRNDDFFQRVSGELTNPDCKLVVPPTHQALLIKDGVLQDAYGPGSYPIHLTVKKGFLGLGKKYDAATLDIIFMNRTIKFQVFWGCPSPIYMRDPLTELPVHLRTNGQFEVGISNAKKFYLEIVGAEKDYQLEKFQDRLQVKMFSYIEPVIAKVMRDNVLSYVDIQLYKRELEKLILPEINRMYEDDCGVHIHSFTIEDLMIEEEEIKAIEAELAQRRKELKEKASADSLAQELERLSDKQFERDVLLKNLEYADKAKYYEVLKIVGDKKALQDARPQGAVGRFCSQCGHSYEAGMAFCPGCGAKLPGGKVFCPECKTELNSDEKFCHKCGHRM